jgi:uncharacterized membrane protein YdjX (TVP38/TMEM64 family)
MSDKELEKTLGTRLLRLISQPGLWWFVAGLVGFVGLIWLVREPLLYLLHQATHARVFVMQFGPWAPVAYIALFALQIMVAPLPGQFFGVMAGYLFGIFWGSLYSLLGLSIGAGVAVLLARRVGRPFVERFFDRDQVAKWERRLRARSPLTWGMLFLFPVPDLAFYVAGLSQVPLRLLIPAVIAGRGVGLLFSGVVGGLAADTSPHSMLVKWGILCGAGLLVYFYQRQVRFGILLSVRRFLRFTRQWRRPTTPMVI